MPKIMLDCPECSTMCGITSTTSAPVQCCPFCGNTLLPALDVEEDGDTDDDSPDFDPEE